MTVEVAFFAGRGLSPTLEAEVRAGISDSIAALQLYEDLGGIGVAVHASEIVSRETGIGGYAYGANSCALYIDPECMALAKNTRSNIAAVLIHELNHVLRMRRPFWPRSAGICAGEVIVLEGLATQCEMFLGYPEPSYVRQASPKLIRQYLLQIEPIVTDPSSSWHWIYSLNDFPIEIYKAVYPMGHCLVGAYLALKQQTPIEALDVPWQDIWNTAFKCIAKNLYKD